MSVGQQLAAPPGDSTGEPVVAAPTRRLRLPRSPKILAGLILLALFVLLAILGPLLAPQDPSVTTADLLQPPSAAHWLGTTQAGQDVFSQLLVGARSTVLVGFVAGVVGVILSIVVGVTAGYVGGLLDDVLSLITNVFLVVPALPLLIVMAAYLPHNVSANPFLTGLIVSITGWAWGARVLRAQTLSMRKRDFVSSARLVGEPRWRIIGFEILPNLTPIVMSSFLFTVLYGIGTYVALAFLGVVDVSHWSWGAMMFWADSASAPQADAWWWFVPPGLAIALLGTSLALVNFGIDEFINPRLRAAGLSRKAAKKAGLPRRVRLGLTPVIGGNR